MFASTYITVDPTWPWDIPYLGLPALAIVALVLVGLTIWTYAGIAKVTRGRLLTVLLLRLGALIVACLLVLRPALAQRDEDSIMPTKLLILVDSSESMNFADEFNGLSRWKNACRILEEADVKEALKNLAQDNKIEVIYYQGAEGVGPFEPQQGATGKRTDFGTWLHRLWQAHGRDGNLRGLLIFSDGADNGTLFSPLEQATHWAGVCPIHTFALGKESTSLKQRDIVLTDITPPSEPVPVKSQFTVTGRIDAWGFKDSPVDVSLWIEEPDTGEPKREMKQAGRKERFILSKVENNEVSLTRDVPATAGEYKVTLKVDPLPGEINLDNNEISSYINATKEGISILWVEGHKRLETAFVLRYALGKDRRFRVYAAEKLADGTSTGEADWFKLDKQLYDVIAIGDISAQRFSSGQPDIFKKINNLVTNKGTGLMLFGGHDSFGNSDWQTQPDIMILMPVTLQPAGQVEGAIRMKPTEAGLNHFLLRLADDPKKNKEIWEKVFDPLDGMTRLGTPKDKATILATDPSGSLPILIGDQKGKGRVLVFAGDTTWKTWRRSAEALPAYERFWKQAMLWLAHQENIEGAAWIKLDSRRVTAGMDRKLGFNVGLKGAGGLEIDNAEFKVKVFGPDKYENNLATQVEKGEAGQRGYFEKIIMPGEYRIEVEANGNDKNHEADKPAKIEGKASARFQVVMEDMETRHPAAEPGFLDRLARAGGGQRHFADEKSLLKLLGELKAQKQNEPHIDRWPDWRRNPPLPQPGQPSSIVDQLTTLWNSAALPCMILFVSFLSLEWYLRRRWEMV
jgi:uncharacterized membrane protein